MKCHSCGKSATCLGSYEGSPVAYGCDACCGHGNEDGFCQSVEWIFEAAREIGGMFDCNPETEENLVAVIEKCWRGSKP